jgi:hypothetical protein
MAAAAFSSPVGAKRKSDEDNNEKETQQQKRNFQDQWCCTNPLWQQCEPWRDVKGRLKNSNVTAMSGQR